MGIPILSFVSRPLTSHTKKEMAWTHLEFDVTLLVLGTLYVFLGVACLVLHFKVWKVINKTWASRGQGTPLSVCGGF
jgi:hypothetical protein